MKHHGHKAGDMTRDRSDHANWTKNSVRRGTYFGMYAAPVADADDTSSANGEKPSDRAKRFLHRVGNDRGRPFARKTKHNLGRKGDGKIRTQEDRLKQYQKDLRETERDVEVLEDVKEHLANKNLGTTIILENLQQANEEQKKELAREMHQFEVERATRHELERKVKSLQEGLMKAHGRLEIEKERYKALLGESAKIEEALQNEIQQAENEYANNEQDLTKQINDLAGKLEEAKTSISDLDEVRAENAQRKIECQRMKQSLQQAKAYTLHKALNATVAASKEQSNKLHKIIAHLQSEQHKTNQLLESITAERNVLQGELRASEQKQRMILASVDAQQDASVFKSKLNSAAAPGTSPLALLARKYAATGDEESAVMKQMKQTIHDLKEKLAEEKAQSEGLELRLQQEKAKHGRQEQALREKLEKERNALLQYAQHLESQLPK